MTAKIRQYTLNAQGGISAVDLIDVPAGGNPAWGAITGTLSSQTDLQTALNAKGTSNFSGAYSALTGKPLNNVSTATQTPTAATLTYLNGSQIAVPAGKLQVGTVFRWRLSVSKTGAGTASNNFHVRIGTAGTTSDVAILTFTTPVGTAVIDTGMIEIQVVIRGPLTSSCIAQGLFNMTHNLATTGLLNIGNISLKVTSSGFDATVANLLVGLSGTSGASTVLSFEQCFAEAFNL